MERGTLKKILKYSGIGLFICIIFGYSFYQSTNLLQGPKISIISPKNGIHVVEPEVLISGVVKNIVAINLDDRPIFVDERGFFKEIYLLSPGDNQIKISAKDKFGKQKTEIVELWH